MMLRFLKNEAYKIEDINTSSSFNIKKLVEKLDSFLSRRYSEIDKIKEDRDFYQSVADSVIPDCDPEPIEDKLKKKYGVPITIKTILNNKVPNIITIDVKIEADDETYRAVGGNIAGFKVGPYGVTDATGIFEFDHIIERILCEDAHRQLDNYFLDGNPSLKEKMDYYKLSKYWKFFEQKHNRRFRWLLGKKFYQCLIHTYNYSCYSYYSYSPFHGYSPLCEIEVSPKDLKHPYLRVPDEQKDEVARDLITLKQILSSKEESQPLFQIIKLGELEYSKNFVEAFASELYISTDDFSIFDVIKDKYTITIISVVESAKDKAINLLNSRIENLMNDDQHNKLNDDQQQRRYQYKKSIQKDIENVHRVVEKIKKIIVNY